MMVEEDGKRTMIDPGKYSTLQNSQKNIDLILITHEHGDHFDLESIKKIIQNNPKVLIITNGEVGKFLNAAGIECQILQNNDSKEFSGVHIAAHGDEHAFNRSGMRVCQNTGYLINKKFFYPGDAFTEPNESIEILALPAAAPWLKISEVLEYAEKLKPKVAFPVHDAMFGEVGIKYLKTVLPEVLNPVGIDVRFLELGKAEEF